jgi:hypothetical protein
MKCFEISKVGLTLLESVVDVQQGQVVPVNVCEAHLGVVGSLLGFIWPDKALRD